MANISILGSCVTRDTLTRIDSERHNIVSYHARTSLASIVSDSLGVTVPPLGNHSEFERRCLEADLNKTFLIALQKSKPDYLIFDFIDERYALYQKGDCIYSENPLAKLDPSIAYIIESSRKIGKSSQEGIHLWNMGLNKTVEEIQRSLPNTKIIFVDARFAKNKRTADGKSEKAFSDLGPWLGSVNETLDYMSKQFIDVAHPVATIRAPENLELADELHRWNLHPFHYIPDWYDYAYEEVRRVIDADVG